MATSKVTLNMEQAIDEFVRKKAAQQFDAYADELVAQFKERIYRERDGIISGIAVRMTKAAMATGKTEIIIKPKKLDEG